MAEVLEATVVVGDKSKGGGGGENEDDESTSSAPEDAGTVAALQVGCRIAYGIRKAIKEELGFTLSAGVSINKTLAKLAASYGKPNGQAVCYPDNVVTMLNETQIGKCRHLGGKRGSKIQALLPAGAPTTVGSIAENLSLKDLERAFSDKKTAVWLWDLAHGIDHEAVSNSTLEHAAAAPPKSITAFKSLPQGHTLDAAQPWLKLLATEIVTRVERDTARHARTPHTCSVSYACHRSRTNTSLRIDFPPVNWNAKQKIQHLIDKATAAIRAKEGKGCQLTRIGLSAGGFRPRDDVGTQRIDHFFSAAAAAAQDKTKTADSTSKPTQHAAGVDDQPPSPEGNVSTKRTAEDKDFELAQKLQERYNTENRLLQQFDEKKKRLMAQRPAKTRRIDSFFTKR
jgi:DNA polymerase eta